MSPSRSISGFILYLFCCQSGRWYIPGPLLPADGLRDVRGGVGNGQQGRLYQCGQTGERYLRRRLRALWPTGLCCRIQVSVMRGFVTWTSTMLSQISKILNLLNVRCQKKLWSYCETPGPVVCDDEEWTPREQYRSFLKANHPVSFHID